MEGGIIALFLAALAVSVSAQTCQFGSIELQAGHTACNRTTETHVLCTSDGSLLDVEHPCHTSPQHCAKMGADGAIRTVKFGQVACLNSTVTQCITKSHRLSTHVKVPIRFGRRRGRFGRRGSRFSREFRYVLRSYYIRVNYFRSATNKTCESEGCVLPFLSTDETVTVLAVNETRCDGGVQRTCGESFALRWTGVCACTDHHRLVEVGETICNRQLGQQRICTFENSTYALQENGTCEVQCHHHGDYYAINHTLCQYGRKFVCSSNGEFERAGECTCVFEGVSYRPFERWCFAGQGYRCGGFGEAIQGDCLCYHAGSLREVNSTWCYHGGSHTCQADGSVQEAGSCEVTCSDGGDQYNVEDTVCAGRRRLKCGESGRWYRYGLCGYRPRWGRRRG